MSAKKIPLPFEVGKTYKTRRGDTARVVCIDKKSLDGAYPILALIEGLAVEVPKTYTSSGRYVNSTDLGADDLIPEYREPVVTEDYRNVMRVSSVTQKPIYGMKPHQSAYKAVESRGLPVQEYLGVLKTVYHDGVIESVEYIPD